MSPKGLDTSKQNSINNVSSGNGAIVLPAPVSLRLSYRYKQKQFVQLVCHAVHNCSDCVIVFVLF
jgi:hypothetical protein